jgi:RNA polymerase sigma-70 factor (ECF subfamily)
MSEASTVPRLDPAVLKLSAVVVTGTITAMLDMTMVAVALAGMTRAFQAPIATVQWVTTAYLLSIAMVIPVTGRLAERFGARSMWLFALTVFITGSALCGTAWSVGGLIVDSLGWRWIFYLNVPVGLLALLLSHRGIADNGQREVRRLDLPGLALLSPAIALLVYGLSRIGTSGGGLLPLAAGAVLLVGVVLTTRGFRGRRHRGGRLTGGVSHSGRLRCCTSMRAVWFEVVPGHSDDLHAVGLVSGSAARSSKGRLSPNVRGGSGMPNADLERLFRAEYWRVVSVARRVVGSEQAAEDVAQEVFLEFSRCTVSPSAARGWLVVAATHRALNVLRAGRRRTDRERRASTDPSLAHPAVVPDVADDVLGQEDRARVRHALATLPSSQASALVLRHSGLSYAEIAHALGISASSVGTILRRAEMALRKEMIRDGSRG